MSSAPEGKIFIALLLAAAFLPIQAQAQPQPQPLQREWVRTYSLSPAREHRAFAISLSPDGGIVIGGSSINSSNYHDYLILKYGPNGAITWDAHFDSTPSLDDIPLAMTLDPAGNVFMTGSSKTVKYSSAGAFRWASSFPGRSVVADTNFVYVTGGSDVDYLTVQLKNNDTDGTNVWSRSHNGTANKGDFSNVIVLDRGRVIVGGIELWSCTGNLCNSKFGVIQYDTTGNQEWHTLGSGSDRFANMLRSIGIAGDGSILLFGGIGLAANIVKLDSSGNQLWYEIFHRDAPEGFYGANYGTQMVCDTNGTAYVVGGRDAIVMTGKVGSDGYTVWTRDYASAIAGSMQSAGIALTPRGNSFITGYTPRTATDSDIFVVEYDNDGALIGEDHYDSSQHGSDVANAIVTDSDGNVYVTGYSTTAEGGSEIVTIKYSGPPKIQRQPGGAIRLEFHAEPGQPFAIEATTNFLTWTGIFTNLANANGLIQFDDTNSPIIPHRFYRGAVAP